MKMNDFYEVNGCNLFIPVDLIEENKCTKDLEVVTRESGRITFVPTIYKFRKPPEHQKPVVHKFVADWVDDSRECGFDFDEWFDCENQPSKVYDWLNSENKRQAELNALALVTLIVNGANAVEIEKEKLYTVEIPNPALDNLECVIVLKRIRGRVCLVNTYDYMGRELSDEYQLTESEIKKDFEWAWDAGFAKEVE